MHASNFRRLLTGYFAIAPIGELVAYAAEHEQSTRLTALPVAENEASRVATAE